MDGKGREKNIKDAVTLLLETCSTWQRLEKEDAIKLLRQAITVANGYKGREIGKLQKKLNKL